MMLYFYSFYDWTIHMKYDKNVNQLYDVIKCFNSATSMQLHIISNDYYLKWIKASMDSIVEST